MKFITMATAFFYLACEDGARKWSALAWLSIGLGVITKGPVAIAAVEIQHLLHDAIEPMDVVADDGEEPLVALFAPRVLLEQQLSQRIALMRIETCRD